MTAPLLRHGRVRRALPRTVRPMAGETVNSYLIRLAAANHITTRDLATHLGTRMSTIATKVALQQLAVASGQPPAVLARALPELTAAPPRASQPATTPGAPVARPACRRCAAVKGITGAVTVWAGPERNVCLRHRLWVGHAVSDSSEQLDLADHPDVIRAQVRYHRLIRRFGAGPVHVHPQADPNPSRR